MDGSTIVVVGSSAGGLAALCRLAALLPSDFPAPVLVVNHMAADTSGVALLRAISDAGSLGATHPTDGEPIERGRIYVAPSDSHMLVERGVIRVTKGAHENRSRPAIDPLFRSAAVAYRNEVVGIVLTGYLDDGTAGLSAIKRCGGTCIVQDPNDADYPQMPRSALDSGVEIDHCVPIEAMGALLAQLVRRERSEPPPLPNDVVIEAKIAARVLSDVASVEELGAQVPFNCPGCGGVLWEVTGAGPKRYRCHTGHAYSAEVLLAVQTEKIEETMWVALRMFEERRNLLVRMGGPDGGGGTSTRERVEESGVHIERIRAMLRSTDRPTDDEG